MCAEGYSDKQLRSRSRSLHRLRSDTAKEEKRQKRGRDKSIDLRKLTDVFPAVKSKGRSKKVKDTSSPRPQSLPPSTSLFRGSRLSSNSDSDEKGDNICRSTDVERELSGELTSDSAALRDSSGGSLISSDEESVTQEQPDPINLGGGLPLIMANAQEELIKATALAVAKESNMGNHLIEKFSGELGQDPKTWLSRFRTYASFRGITDNNKKP